MHLPERAWSLARARGRRAAAAMAQTVSGRWRDRYRPGSGRMLATVVAVRGRRGACVAGAPSRTPDALAPAERLGQAAGGRSRSVLNAFAQGLTSLRPQRELAERSVLDRRHRSSIEHGLQRLAPELGGAARVEDLEMGRYLGLQRESAGAATDRSRGWSATAGLLGSSSTLASRPRARRDARRPVGRAAEERLQLGLQLGRRCSSDEAAEVASGCAPPSRPRPPW